MIPPSALFSLPDSQRDTQATAQEVRGVSAAMGKTLYILHETAAGFGLFVKDEAEEIGSKDYE